MGPETPDYGGITLCRAREKRNEKKQGITVNGNKMTEKV